MERSVARVRPLLAVWLTAGLLLVLWPQPASACSCAMVEPEQALADADAAFVGTLVEQRGDRWVFDVDAVLAGDLPTPLAFRSEPGDGANCGLTPNVGARYGLLMYREGDGQLTSNGCLQHDPDLLLAAGQPREPTPAASEDETAPSADGSGGWPIIVGTAGGAAAILGGVLMWGRRRPTG